MPLLLIVEDDEDIRETVTDLLKEQGHHVEGATDGSDALRRLRAGLRPQLIFLDRTMPVMDGSEFRRHQLADPEIAAIPIVLMTAANLVDHVVEEMRPQYILRKPMSFDDLLATVDRALPPS